jgi:hypothetical protein
MSVARALIAPEASPRELEVNVQGVSTDEPLTVELVDD